MSVKVTGLKKLQDELERKLGAAAMIKIVDQSLLMGAEVIKKELEANFARFKDTGASLNEITVAEPTDGTNGRTVKIHWRGPNGRYRIIHLNEWGTIKNPNPAGKGAVALSLENGKNEYRKVIKKMIEGAI
ncbi:hypothetical protein [Jeotgalibaca porci]|uniref:hypothetical protein n=1 Tax=Jeotgalibaca porci TaxID=1868793 RepID=UPI00359F686D